jgi:hypothetical protein
MRDGFVFNREGAWIWDYIGNFKNLFSNRERTRKGAKYKSREVYDLLGKCFYRFSGFSRGSRLVWFLIFRNSLLNNREGREGREEGGRSAELIFG